MATPKTVSILFNADTATFTSEVKKGGKALKDLKSNVDKGKGSLDALKKGLGEDSKFGAFAKILSGAGAVAGLTLVGNELNKLADKFASLKKLNEEGAGAGQIAEELAKSLPVFGTIFEAGRKIRGELDGSAEAARKVTAETAALNASTDYAAGRFEILRDTTAGLAGQLRKVRDEINLIGKSTQDVSLAGIATGQRDELEAARKNRDADRKRIADNAKGGRDALGADSDLKLRALRDAADELADASGRAFDGRKNRAQAAFNAAKGEFELAASQRAKLTAQEQADLTAKEVQYQETVKAIEQKYGMTRVQLEKQIHNEVRETDRAAYDARITARRAYLTTIADMDAANRDARLRFEGKGFQADREAIFRDAAKAGRDNLTPMVGQVISNGANPFATGNGSLAQTILQAAGLAGAAHGQRDQKLELLWKGAIGDKIRATFEALPENPASLLSPAALGAWAKSKLMGPGDKNYSEDVGPGKQSLPTAVQRRFDFTIPGVDDPHLLTAKEQLKAQLQQAKAQAEGNVILKSIVDKAIAVAGIK